MSLMLKKLASYPKQNGLAKALREIGRIERTPRQKTGKSELPGQWTDAADRHHLPVEYAVYGKIEALKREGLKFNEQLLSHLSPLG